MRFARVDLDELNAFPPAQLRLVLLLEPLLADLLPGLVAGARQARELALR